MFRLIGFLFLVALTAGGYLAFDYKMSSRWSGKDGGEGLTFSEYLSALPGRLGNLGGAASAAGLPTKLADMLPKAPDGWTVRPVDPKDTEGFLPKSTKKADKAGIAAIDAMATTTTESGTEVAALTYEKGDGKLIIKATRYPNVIFTSTASMQQRFDLQTTTAQFRGTEFATVRGLDVTEDLLPEGFRGRMFLAVVGGQIHLRILAPKRMSDEDFIPFLETLHVKAMNADVVDTVEGLGDVPVIVLVSQLDDTARDAYLADVAAREARKTQAATAEKAKVDAETAAAEAETAEAAPEDGGFLGSLFGASEPPAEEAAPTAAAPKIGCSTGKDGVKRCTVEDAAPSD